ncbi:restriction endonuclease [Loigolactobacillus bifermentans]|nr:restriction endonuclease [Loigolactobacillus bifermentans]
MANNACCKIRNRRCFTDYDGLAVIHKLTVGKIVQLVAEPDNLYDAQVVAIDDKTHQLDAMPHQHNAWLNKLLHFGYQDALEAHIQTANLENHPERQFRVAVQLKNNKMH